MFARREITFVAILLTLPLLLHGQGGTENAVSQIRKGVSAGTQKGWAKDIRDGKASFLEAIDRYMICALAGCETYTAQSLQAVEEGFAAQYTVSLSGEVVGTAVDERLRSYRSAPFEYAAFRLLAILAQDSIDGVLIEGRRIQLDRQRLEAEGDTILPRLLRPASWVAGMVIGHRDQELSPLLLSQPPGGIDGLNSSLPDSVVPSIPVVLLMDLVPLPEEDDLTVSWLSGGEVQLIHAVAPVIPATPQAAEQCWLHSDQGVTTPLQRVEDFAAAAREYHAGRATKALARSALRSVGKAIAADQLGDLVTGDMARGRAQAARSLINILIAATERADTRSPRYVPRLVYLGSVRAEEGKTWTVKCDTPFHRRTFPVLHVDGRPVLSAFNLRGTWGGAAMGIVGSPANDGD